jgi:hypothetical protein
VSLPALTRLSMEPGTGWPLLRHCPSVSFSSDRIPVASIITAAAGMHRCFGSRHDQNNPSCQQRLDELVTKTAIGARPPALACPASSIPTSPSNSGHPKPLPAKSSAGLAQPRILVGSEN